MTKLLDSNYPREELPQRYEELCDEEISQGGEVLEFRLVYDGRLRAEGRKQTRSDDKHIIRKVLHGQLMELWRQNPALHELADRGAIKHLSEDFQRGDGFNFVPLCSEKCGGAYASLDILFLRRSDPGKLIEGAGDIDNRIKTLFDALKVPKTRSEINSDSPEAGESPFFCLLEDDSRITSLRVTTDRLLWPLPPEAPSLPRHPLNDVFLVIHVKTEILDPRNIFAGVFR